MPPWRPDSPVELPDGRLVCKMHGLTICGLCTVDYSFMDDILNEDGTDSGLESDSHDSMPTLEDIEDDIHHEHAEDFDEIYEEGVHFGLLPGQVKPDVSTFISERFAPSAPTDIPQSLFVARIKTGIPGLHYPRFVRKSNPKEILIYTDGACFGNAQQNSKAGCGFVFRPSTLPTPVGENSTDGAVSFRLEAQGPTGEPQLQTSNRAELRAVIGVLQFRVWWGEGWKRLVIATDSEYVVNGATGWVRGWERNGWVTAKKQPVKNRDFWELLLEKVREHAENGLAVLFWRIPRELNKVADEAAKKGANMEEQTRFTKIHGFLC